MPRLARGTAAGTPGAEERDANYLGVGAQGTSAPGSLLRRALSAWLCGWRKGTGSATKDVFETASLTVPSGTKRWPWICFGR